jgi:arylsulfatase A-like enzyme
VVSGAVLRGSRGFARGFDRFHDDLRSPPVLDDLVALRLVRLLRDEDDPRVFRAEAPRALERAEAFLDTVPLGAPWFLWVHLYDVHLPHTLDEEAAAPFLEIALDGLPDPCDYKDHPVPIGGPGGIGPLPALRGPNAGREQERRCGHMDSLRARVAGYRSEVQIVDAAAAALLALVEARGDADRTAVIVTADHGESLTEHGMRMSHQYSAYEPVLRVPLIVVPPGGGPARRSGVLVQHRDLRATAAELLGREAVPGGSPWISGPALPLVASVTHIPFLTMRRALHQGASEGDGGRRAPVRVAVRDGVRSIVVTPGLPTEIYDLSDDPHQMVDLASTTQAAPPDALARAAASIVAQLSDRDPPQEEEADPDLEALRALGYVE